MDAVIWLERGRVRAMARHHELWQNPDYRMLFGADEPPPPGGGTVVPIGAGA
jgi:ATP-binding cassette subfamily B protein